MPKRIAVLITNNFEDQEYLEPVAALLAAHHSVCNIELNAGKVVYGLHGCSAVTIDRGIEQISIDDFDALLIPGGESAVSLYRCSGATVHPCLQSGQKSYFQFM